MMDPTEERIAVTGIGIVSALGPDAATTFSRLCAGDAGFGPLSLFDASGQRSQIAAEVRGLRVSDVAPHGEAAAWSRSDALAVTAARQAVGQARVGPELGLGVAVGATTGGMFEAEDVLASTSARATAESARRLLAYPLSTSGDRIAQAIANVRRRVTICSACSSGAIAIASAVSWLRAGAVDAVLAGGTDGLCRLTFAGFNALGATSTGVCRPFDRARDGLTLGEGAAFLLLETERQARARGVPVLAWLSGFAIAAEAHHITHPEPDGATAARLIAACLRSAALTPAELDYVNAHGTGTLANDAMEARALSAALGAEVARVAVTSSKGQLGHTLGAAGALEAALTVLALERGAIPPSGGLREPDPELPLRHVRGTAEAGPLRAALSSSFGFGGTGVVLAFEHAGAEPRRREAARRPSLVLTGSVTLGRAGVICGAENVLHVDPHASPPTVVLDPLAELDPARSRRFDRASALVTLGVERALAGARLKSAGVGLVAGTAFGNVERSVAFLRRVFERGPRFASPADFPHLVPSAPSGNASIHSGLTGPVISVSDLSTSAETALEVARGFVELGLAGAVVAGSAEPEDGIVAHVLGPLLAGRPAAADEGAGFVVIESRAHAEGRGAPVLAELAAIAIDARELSSPRDAARARVILAEDDAADQLLAGSPWAEVARLSLGEHVGRHEARGAFALSAAAALIASGHAEEVLAVGRERDRARMIHLVAPGPRGR